MKEVILPLFADKMTLHKEEPKDSTQRFLELLNKFCKHTKISRVSITINYAKMKLRKQSDLQ